MSESVRPVARVVTPEPVIEGAGVRLRRSLGTRALDYLDPFLLLDHFESAEPADYEAGQGSRSLQTGTGFRFYGFVGVEGRFVPWNVFLDGNVFRESLSVDRKYLTADFSAGVVLRLGAPLGISYAQVFRTGEQSNDPRFHNFGSIAVSLTFDF